MTLELTGDGHSSRLTVYGRTFAAFSRLRSFNVSGFAEVTVKQHGLLVKNADANFVLTIGRVRNLSLDTNAVQPTTGGTVDALIEDCHTVRLSKEVVSKLRSFAFRRIESLELSENTFKKAAEGSTIAKVRVIGGIEFCSGVVMVVDGRRNKTKPMKNKRGNKPIRIKRLRASSPSS